MSPELLNKHFQGYPHNAYVENAIESLMAPHFQHINKVHSGNRQTHSHTHSQSVTLMHAPRVNYLIVNPKTIPLYTMKGICLTITILFKKKLARNITAWSKLGKYLNI